MVGIRNFLNSNQGKAVTQAIVDYRSAIAPLAHKRASIERLSGKVDDHSVQMKQKIKKQVTTALQLPRFREIKENFEDAMNILIIEIIKENEGMRYYFIEIIDYNFLRGPEQAHGAIDVIVKKIYEHRRIPQEA